jgi:restriction system protein
MKGTDFEYFLKVHFQRLGYKADTTSVTNDYGADLILKRDKERIVIQANRYKEKVGIKAIQEIIGAKGYYNATKGMVVTNSNYTKNAINLANANQVELWDRKKLIDVMIKDKDSREIIKEIKEVVATKIENRICLECGKELIERKGNNRRFIGCSNYPKCKFTSNR